MANFSVPTLPKQTPALSAGAVEHADYTSIEE